MICNHCITPPSEKQEGRAVTAGVVCHRICKWLDRRGKDSKQPAGCLAGIKEEKNPSAPSIPLPQMPDLIEHQRRQRPCEDAHAAIDPDADIDACQYEKRRYPKALADQLRL